MTTLSPLNHRHVIVDSPTRDLHLSRSALVVDTKVKNVDYLAPVSSVSTALSGGFVERVVVDGHSQVRNDVHALSSKIDSVLSRARSASPVSIRAHDIHVLESSKYTPSFASLHTSTLPINTVSTTLRKSLIVPQPVVSTIRESVVVPRTTVSQITNTQNIKDIVITKPQVKYVHQEPVVQTRYVHQEPVVQTRYVHQEPIVQTKYVHQEPIVHTRYVHQEPIVQTKYVHQEPIVHTRYVDVPKVQEIFVPRTEVKYVHQEPIVHTRTIEVPKRQEVYIPRTYSNSLHYSSVLSSPVHSRIAYKPEVERVLHTPTTFSTIRHVDIPRVEYTKPVYEPIKYTAPVVPKVDIKPAHVHQHNEVVHTHHHHCCHHHCCGNQKSARKGGHAWGKLQNDVESRILDNEEQEQEEQPKANNNKKTRNQRNQRQEEGEQEISTNKRQARNN